MNGNGCFGAYIRGVHEPLIKKLGDVSGITAVVVDRFSKDEGDGLESQVARHLAHYKDDRDAAEYQQLIGSGAFDLGAPPDARVGALSPREIHHLAADTRDRVVFAKLGKTLFLRINLSAVERTIRRDDGSSDNVYTILMLSLLTHLDALEEVRWGVDLTRAARDQVNWAMLMRRHQERNIAMVFAGERYDPTIKGDRVTLNVLGALTSEDDPERRRKLVEAKVARYLAGELCLAPEFLPYGWCLPVNQFGRVPKGAIPVGDLSQAEALRAVHELHSKGATSTTILTKLAELESEGKITRRSGLKSRKTFADSLESEDPSAQTAVVSHFVRGNIPPAVPRPVFPGDDAIQRYLQGADPQEVFDVSQRLVISKIEAIRTGKWLRILRNDIAQRRLVLAGIETMRFDPEDPCGFFLIEAPAAFPIDPDSGEVIERFGIEDAVLRRSAARLLSLLQGSHRTPTGGQAHVRAERRPFQSFGEWTDGTYNYRAGAYGGARDGLVNTLVHRRPADVTGSWKRYVNDSSNHTWATIRQAELAASVADAVENQVEEGIWAASATSLLTELDTPSDSTAKRKQRHERQAQRLQEASEECQRRAEGAREMAALLMGQGERTRALEYDADAARHDQEAASLARKATVELAKAHDASPAPEAPVLAEVSAVAYLVAGLRRAGSGRVSAHVATVADRLISNWRLLPSDHLGDNGSRWVEWSADLSIPLAESDDHVVYRIKGRVLNVRSTRKSPTNRHPIPPVVAMWSGPRHDNAAIHYLRDGKTLEETSLATQVSPRVLVRSDLRGWLTKAGMSNAMLVSALIDHPLPAARQTLYGALTESGDQPDLSGYNPAWVDHMVSTYTDPARRWGPAACPDDVQPAHRVIETLAAIGPVHKKDLARVLDVPVQEVGRLATPSKLNPKGGWARPRYAAWFDPKHQVLSAIPCPHPDCTGTADRVVLLPETAASGYAVMCSACRRMPNTTDTRWQRIVFPPAYLEARWTSGPRHPRPEYGRTMAVLPPAHVQVAPIQMGTA